MRSWIVCVVIAWPLAALAAPRVTAQGQYKAATAQYESGHYDQALALVAAGLVVAPRDVPLLLLRATMLLELRNYPEALAAYKALIAAGLVGPDRRSAQNIVDKLRAVQSTFLEITIANGPATVYLDTRTLGVFCAPGAQCKHQVLPNQYTVIAERPGFERFTQRITVPSGQIQQVAITLVEKPSPLAVQVEPAGAEITVDGAPYDAARPLPAGKHVIAAAAPGHRTERREIQAREGTPVELALTLVPLVPARVVPAGAALALDGAPTTLDGDALAVPAGAHALVARAPGFQERKIEIPAERPDDYAIEVKLEPVVVAPPPPPPPSRFTGRRKLALGAAALGVAALGAGVGLGLSARGLDADAYALCPSPGEPCADAARATDLNERARSRALTANVAYGVAGGAAVAVALLWLTGAPETRARVAVTPRLGAVAGLDLAMRF